MKSSRLVARQGRRAVLRRQGFKLALAGEDVVNGEPDGHGAAQAIGEGVLLDRQHLVFGVDRGNGIEQADVGGPLGAPGRNG